MSNKCYKGGVKRSPFKVEAWTSKTISKKRLDKWVKEIWENKHGKIYEWLKWNDAEEFLIEQMQWEVRNAYSLPDWRNVTAFWNKPNPKTWEERWLIKLYKRHPEAIGKIQSWIDTLPKKSESENRIIFEKRWEARVVIAKELDWGQESRVLSAFELLD